MMINRAKGPKALVAGTAVVLCLLIVPPFLSEYVLELLTQTLIWAITAASLDILLGYTGLPSLGHATYMGVGAYATAILLTQAHASFFAALGISLLLSAVLAALFGLLALRAKGHYFLLITMALAMVVWGLAYRWVSFTNGDNGIVDVPRPSLGLGVSFGPIQHFYYLALAIFLVSFTLLLLFVRSPFGLTLVGIRESQSRMRSLGYNVWLHKYLAFIVAGVFSGLSGVLWATYNGFVSPMDVDAFASLETLLMVALGGPGTLFGPILGAGIIVFLKNLASIYVHRWMTLMGVIFILTVYYAPDGILGYFWAAPTRARDGKRQPTAQ
jgi:branched-chain amino acid transport system permease protein